MNLIVFGLLIAATLVGGMLTSLYFGPFAAGLVAACSFILGVLLATMEANRWATTTRP